MNSVWLSGKAQDDVWIRKNERGRLIASFVILDGENAIRCIAFDKMADKAGMMVKKDRFVEVSGALSLYRSKNKENKVNYIYNVMVDGLEVPCLEGNKIDR